MRKLIEVSIDLDAFDGRGFMKCLRQYRKIKLCFGDQRTLLSLEIPKLKCTYRRTDCVQHLVFSKSAFQHFNNETWRRVCIMPKQRQCKSRSFRGIRQVFLEVITWMQSNGRINNYQFRSAFTLIKVSYLAGRRVPYCNYKDTHNALQDVLGETDT